MPCDIFCSGSNNPEPRSQYIEKAKCCLPTHLPEHQDGSLPDQNSGLKPDQAHFHAPDLGFRSPFTFTITIYKTNYSQIHSLTSLHLLPYMKTYIHKTYILSYIFTLSILLPGPPRTRIPFAEKCAHGLLISAGVLAGNSRYVSS